VQIHKEQAHGKVIAKEPGQGEPAIKITLFQALLKTDKFEFVLQKCVELGVTTFVPFVSERCVVSQPSESKIERWQKIIRETAEQSKRSVLPILHPTVSFQEACKLTGVPSILLWEGEKSTSFKRTLKSQPFKKASSINIFVGPEGGFPSSEVEYAQQLGVIPVSLGNRILRAETAGLVAISAILYERGEMG
jgi:16S rRNA (uracil1498-N3)-methyltransferase